MGLPRISGKALWKIIEDAGVNPHWVTGFSYQVKDRIMKIEMIAVVDNSPVLNEAKDGIETTMVDIPVCSCTIHCAEIVVKPMQATINGQPITNITRDYVQEAIGRHNAKLGEK